MLLNLHVKNLAIIQEAEIDFTDHLNILTGETGAGKSVIIGSVTLALGAKASRDVIREGAEYALVELLFHVEDPKTIQLVRELDLPVEEGEILISRKLYPGRAVNKINGETVTASAIRKIASHLIDIHGQHEHQSLLHKEKHLEIVDQYARDQELRHQVREAWERYRLAEKELEKSRIPEEERLRECSFLEYEQKEIQQARLQPGEEEELAALYRRLSNLNLIEEETAQVYRFTGEGEDSAGEQIGRALRSLARTAPYDPELDQLQEQLIQVEDILGEFNRSLSEYRMGLDFDHGTMAETEERLDEIRRIQSKYGGSYESVCSYVEEIGEKLERYRQYDLYIEELEREVEEARKSYEAGAEALSRERKKAAGELGEKIREVLRDLNFLDVQFEIACGQRREPGAEGVDDLEFMISTNPGERVRSLGAVASGGELSRIMLAIKSILAEQDAVDTLIFDEIDTGISGVTAQKVAERMVSLSAVHQVICITHLQQIAAMADTHFLIEKQAGETGTKVEIRTLGEEESVEELARMLGGVNRSEAVVSTARELKEMARSRKTYR